MKKNTNRQYCYKEHHGDWSHGLITAKYPLYLQATTIAPAINKSSGNQGVKNDLQIFYLKCVFWHPLRTSWEVTESHHSQWQHEWPGFYKVIMELSVFPSPLNEHDVVCDIFFTYVASSSFQIFGSFLLLQWGSSGYRVLSGYRSAVCHSPCPPPPLPWVTHSSPLICPKAQPLCWLTSECLL